MLNEVNPNLPPERTARFEGIGLPEVGFVAGFGLAIVGIAAGLGVWVSMLAAGAVLMAIAWRAA